MDNITLVSSKIIKIEKLTPDGTRSECEFEETDGTIRVKEALNILIPVILFIK